MKKLKILIITGLFVFISTVLLAKTFLDYTYDTTPTGSDAIPTVKSPYGSTNQRYTKFSNLSGLIFQAYDSDLDTWATVTPSNDGKSLVSAATYAAMRVLLDLEPGIDFYSISAADSQFLENSQLDDTKGNGDTTYLWSADKIYDQFTAILDGSTPFTVITASDGTDIHKIKAVQETGLGGRLTFGIDETARAMIVCDYGDIDTDLGLSVDSQPRLFVFSAAANEYAIMKATGIYVKYSAYFNAGNGYPWSASGQTFSFTSQTDKDSGNIFTLNSGSGDEITDTDGEQSWLYIEPKVNQANAETGAAGYNGLQIKVTETDIDTAADNNLIKAGTSTDDDVFKVSNKGMIRTKPETVTCASDVGTANANVRTSFLVSDGDSDNDEDTVGLADGQSGEEKVFVFMTDTDTGDSVNITPTHLKGGTKILFDTEGEGCIMVFDGTNWNIVSNNGGVIS